MIASTFSGIHDFIHSGTWQVIRNLLFFFLIAFWLAVGYWVYKDAKRRIEDPVLIATAVANLQASIYDPYGKTTFSVDRADSSCAFEPPAWADNAVCEAHNIGMVFNAPLLVPGTYVRISIRYTQTADAIHRPIVRINPRGDTKVQLIKPGIQTFVARFEAPLLVGLLGVTLVLFAVSVAAGVRDQAP